MQQSLIAASYNIIANEYLANRERLKSGKYITQLLKLLPKHSTILDLGCGAGIPVDDLLLKAGHSVVGVDISPKQIAMARQNCPRGEYSVRDINSLEPREFLVQAIVSFYTLFHLPRSIHQNVLSMWAGFLDKGGLLLVTLGDREFEGFHELYGQKLWSSQFGTVKNREIIKKAGFEIIREELDTSGGERHQIFLARKI